MQLIGLARLGNDVTIRTTQSGEKVANLSLAFNHGRKGEDGKRPTQWVDASLWGKRAEALADYLTKGKMVVVTVDDPHIESYEGRNGTGHKLVGNISAIELAGDSSGGGGQQRSAAPAPAPRPAPAPAPKGSQGFDDMDDDIPF